VACVVALCAGSTSPALQTFTAATLGQYEPSSSSPPPETTYSGGGHTIESYSEPAFRRHLLGGIKWAAKLAEGDCGTVWSSFERVTLAKTAAETGEPIGLAGLPNRGVLHNDEDGLQAVAVDPDFANNNWVYAPPLEARR
jgi:hypothetical protein